MADVCWSLGRRCQRMAWSFVTDWRVLETWYWWKWKEGARSLFFPLWERNWQPWRVLLGQCKSACNYSRQIDAHTDGYGTLITEKKLKATQPNAMTVTNDYSTTQVVYVKTLSHPTHTHVSITKETRNLEADGIYLASDLSNWIFMTERPASVKQRGTEHQKDLALSRAQEGWTVPLFSRQDLHKKITKHYRDVLSASLAASGKLWS